MQTSNDLCRTTCFYKCESRKPLRVAQKSCSHICGSHWFYKAIYHNFTMVYNKTHKTMETVQCSLSRSNQIDKDNVCSKAYHRSHSAATQTRLYWRPSSARAVRAATASAPLCRAAPPSLPLDRPRWLARGFSPVILQLFSYQNEIIEFQLVKGRCWQHSDFLSFVSYPGSQPTWSFLDQDVSRFAAGLVTAQSKCEAMFHLDQFGVISLH